MLKTIIANVESFSEGLTLLPDEEIEYTKNKIIEFNKKCEENKVVLVLFSRLSANFNSALRKKKAENKDEADIDDTEFCAIPFFAFDKNVLADNVVCSTLLKNSENVPEETAIILNRRPNCLNIEPNHQDVDEQAIKAINEMHVTVVSLNDNKVFKQFSELQAAQIPQEKPEIDANPSLNGQQESKEPNKTNGNGHQSELKHFNKAAIISLCEEKYSKSGIFKKSHLVDKILKGDVNKLEDIQEHAKEKDHKNGRAANLLKKLGM